MNLGLHLNTLLQKMMDSIKGIGAKNTMLQKPQKRKHAKTTSNTRAKTRRLKKRRRLRDIAYESRRKNRAV